MRAVLRISAAVIAAIFLTSNTSAQEPAVAQPIALTLKRAIELALQNSKDIQMAKIQASIADRAALINRAQFMPNVYAGSGAGYTYGIPETPGGRAPSVFNVTYTEQVLPEFQVSHRCPANDAVPRFHPRQLRRLAPAFPK